MAGKLSILFFLSHLLLLCNSIVAQSNQIAIGQWQDHLPYQNATQIVKGTEFVCATPYALFQIDNSGEIERISKANQLTDVGVSAIAWDATTQQWVIAFENSNLNILSNSRTRSIGDIRRSNIPGDKRIRNIFCNNGLAYLSTGIGIIVVNVQRVEIAATWIVGRGGQPTQFNEVKVINGFIYAASIQGLQRIPLQTSNAGNFQQWEFLSGQAALPGGEVNQILSHNNQLIIRKNDSLLVLRNNQWELFYNDASWPIIKANAEGGRIVICQRSSNGQSRVIVLNNDGMISQTIAVPEVISFPRDALWDNSKVWVADFFGGLSLHDGTPNIQRFRPIGPLGFVQGDMLFQKDSLWAAAGTVNDNWNYQFNRNGIFKRTPDNWTFIGSFNKPQLDTLLDFITLTTDPVDQSIWAGSYGGGLVRIAGTSFQVFKQNSSLQPAIGDPGSYRVSGLAFDLQRNLWVSNYGAAQPLHVRKADGSWRVFSIPFFLNENGVEQIVCDSFGNIWIVGAKGNGLIAYQPNQPDLTNDDRWRWFRAGTGVGNLPSNQVNHIAIDKNGLLWIATARGLAFVPCLSDIFQPQTCEAFLPVVQSGGFAGNLLASEDVLCIAVDGANRKWAGTRRGLFLIAPDGNRIVQQFTNENSPLLGNTIYSMTIHPVTGEVYVATDQGLCSFRSTATDAAVATPVLVFPNPVPANFTGNIAIRGLPDESLVKIIEPNGRLVFQTRSLGGQAIWNGRDYQQRKVASGIYLVLARSDDGTEKEVAKIAITTGQ